MWQINTGHACAHSGKHVAEGNSNSVDNYLCAVLKTIQLFYYFLTKQ